MREAYASVHPYFHPERSQREFFSNSRMYEGLVLLRLFCLEGENIMPWKDPIGVIVYKGPSYWLNFLAMGIAIILAMIKAN